MKTKAIWNSKLQRDKDILNERVKTVAKKEFNLVQSEAVHFDTKKKHPISIRQRLGSMEEIES